MVKGLKTRLDSLMVERELAPSRERARAMIMAGNVRVNDVVVDKAGTKFLPHVTVSLKEKDIPYVSRGGLKLEKALNVLSLDLSGLTCLDIGASTGGFTDCMLQNGAAKVYAVDVGYGQMAWSLRQDKRVKVIERTNIRYIDFDTIGESVDLISIDTSFISLKLVVPAAEQFMEPGTLILALIKPQFEAGKERIGKGGVVRDPLLRREIVEEIVSFFVQRGYETQPVIESPVPGPKGNIEFILPMKKTI
ncbi:23S rRNA (cytidine1920-2'-O)/16S rRNA (cytidine1409-2'-O)-methyltransferase [Desulfocicer vacuolatum DSM 3385]|uniref:23S rRNA (Cytidine1920-2'-O)/16S rRNA (Cytidine1409-2'-O)-methyltransferase n=1 Tax=Desulfocicer vacuolatum DSM 3385 TaxID=1121400 RepID=A0A1W2AJ47_9BACT|nr:TlyA family RNA methyltransferase [Desulfocicer vacuolatum]SMC60542.1 23S rRNA (cytidine1920-2'-O)/16S rRNA (cytidine1409-2'-O)-methyltransferase [Desulfocicer vacuolatum DSM 3385]